MLQSNQQQNSNSQRWWEYYLMRYLIGTILGLFIVSYIVINNPILNSFVFESKNDLKWLDILKGNYWTFLALGFAYCYLASAPILVFHACRYTFKRKTTRQFWPKCIRKKFQSLERSIFSRFFKVLFLIVVFVIFLVLLKSEGWINEMIDWYTYLLYVIIGVQLLLIINSIFLSGIEDFYSELSNKRKVKKRTDQEFIQSYKHLREHGNAFLILLSEFSLGYILINASSINEVITILTLWILPAALVWFQATQLEFTLFK